MPIPVTQFQPMSYDQNAAGVQGLQAGSTIANNNLQSQINLTKAMQQAIHQSLINQAASATLPFAGPQASATLKNQQLQNQQLGLQMPYAAPLAKANVGNINAQANQSNAAALSTNVNSNSGLLGQLRQLQATRGLMVQQGADPQTLSMIDNSISNLNNMIQQTGMRTGFGNGMRMNIQTPQAPQPNQQINPQGTSMSPSSGGGLPMTLQQLQTLHQMNFSGGAPGTIGGNLTGQPGQGGMSTQMTQPGQSMQPSISSEMQSTNNMTPNNLPSIQEQQNQQIQRDRVSSILAGMTGNPGLQSATGNLLNHDYTGTAQQQAASAADKKNIESISAHANDGAQLKYFTDQYRQTLAQIPPITFTIPLNKMSPEMSGKIQYLQSLSKQMIPLESGLTGMNINRITNQEFNNSGKSTANPQQYLSAVNAQLQNLDNISDRATLTYNSMQQYLKQGKGLAGFNFNPGNQFTNNPFNPQSAPQRPSGVPGNYVRLVNKNTGQAGYVNPSRVNDYLTSKKYSRG